MRLRSVLLCLGLGALGALGATLSGCGSDGGAAGDGTGGPSPSPTGSGPATDAPSATPAAIDAAPVAMTQLLAGFDWQTAFVLGGQKRIFSITPVLSASLQRVTVAAFDGANAEVTTLAVKGKVPTGRIEAIAYAEGIDKVVAIVRAQRPHRIEIVTIALGGADATIETVAQPSPLEPNGAMFSALYPKGGGGLLAVRGNDLLTLSVGATATWSAPSPASSFYRGNGTAIVLDAKRSRLVAYGKDVFDPVSKTVSFEPSIGTMPLSGPYAWTEVSLGAPPPAAGQSIAPNWAALDAESPRLLAIVPVMGTCGPTECMKQSLWAANLGTGSWTKLLDHYNPTSFYKPFAVDDAGRRVFSLADGALLAQRLDEASTFQDTPLVQKGDLGPQNASSAVVSKSGKIVSADGGVLRVYDPSSATPRWERFGTAKLPPGIGYRPSMTEDPDTGEILVFGGASSNASDPSPDLLVVAKDGAAITKETVTGTPPARVGHGAAMVGRALVVVGGSQEGASATSLDDVWSFDRASRAWKSLGKLPKPLAAVTARRPLPGASEVLAIGYAKGAGSGDATIAPIVAIDVTTGKARELTTKGEAPSRLWSKAPLGTCFVGFESGDTVDGTEPMLWRCKREGDVVTWEKSPIDANDYALGGMVDLRGASPADGSKAYFVGSTTWAVLPKK